MEIEKFQAELKKTVEDVLEAKLKTVVGEEAAKTAKMVVEKMALDRVKQGYDISGLSEKQKVDFAVAVKEIAAGNFNNINIKANEALVEEQDNRGGYLVSREVANAIIRIAASVGLAMSQAQTWPMSTDELGIPTYTGSFLSGEYLGFDAAGSLTAVTFGSANLIIKKWQLAFAIGNDLLQDASPRLADWLLSLAGEALANMVDQQVFAGTGAPFVGLLNHDGVTVMTLASGKDTFAEYAVMADSSAAIGSVEESVLDGAAFYMHRTVWASLRTQYDTAGNPILQNAGAPTAAILVNNPTGGGVKPAGEILGFPVFTTRHMPALSATAVSTKFIIFGNLKAVAFGERGEFRVDEFKSGTFGGKEIALADQRALVYKHRHAIVVALPAAFVAIKTAAS